VVTIAYYPSQFRCGFTQVAGHGTLRACDDWWVEPRANPSTAEGGYDTAVGLSRQPTMRYL
jgi:hypothetical protein